MLYGLLLRTVCTQEIMGSPCWLTTVLAYNHGQYAPGQSLPFTPGDVSESQHCLPCWVGKTDHSSACDPFFTYAQGHLSMWLRGYVTRKIFPNFTHKALPLPQPHGSRLNHWPLSLHAEGSMWGVRFLSEPLWMTGYFFGSLHLLIPYSSLTVLPLWHRLSHQVAKNISKHRFLCNIKICP